MNNELFIQEFKKSSYYDYLLSLHPYFITLGGSRGADIGVEKDVRNEASDWDVVVVVPNKIFPKFDRSQLNGAELNYDFHVLIYPLNLWLDYVCNTCNCDQSNSHDSFIRYSVITRVADQKHTIYSSEFGETILKYIYEYKKEIAEIGALKLAKVFSLHLKYYNKNDIINLESQKYYYHLLLAYDIIFEENNKKLIKNVRNNGFNRLEEDEQEQIYIMFKKLLDHLNNLELDCWDNILINLKLIAHFDTNNTNF